MDPDSVNEQFRAMAIRAMADDMDAVIDRVLHLEAASRHELECTGDTQAANDAAAQAYSIFMDVSMKMAPTLIMGLADKANREKEALLSALDAIDSSATGLTAVIEHFENGRANIGKAVLVNVLDTLKLALDEAPYAKSGDGDE